MDSKAPIKSVLLSANLETNFLKYTLCPVNEFSEGVWNIAIKSIAFSCEIRNFKEICQISCNLCKAQKRNQSFQVQSYQQPFGTFVMQEGKHVIYFGMKV